MKAWISFFLRYTLLALIGISAIIFLVPTNKDYQQDLAKNIEQLDISQLAVIFKSFTDNITEADSNLEVDSDLEVEQEFNTDTPKPIINNHNSHVKKTYITDNNSEPWGIVSAPKASYYTTKGKFIGHLSPGTALNIIKITETGKGPIAVCRPFKQSSSELILTNPDHLTIRHNNINKISKELEKMYVQHAQLKAEIDTIKKQKAKELRRDNPNARKYTICKKRYHDYWAKVEDLTKKRDTASGKKQMDYADELRLMKGEDIIIANELKEAKQEYNKWNLTHPRPENNNSEVNNLLTELSRIGKIISRMEKNK